MESAFQQALSNIGGLLNQARLPTWRGVGGAVNALDIRAKAGIDQSLRNLRAKSRETEPSLAPPITAFGRNILEPTGNRKKTTKTKLKKIKATPTLTSTALPTKIPTKLTSQASIEELIKAIETGSKGSPVATMAAQMVNTGQNMPVFQRYPFLPVAISHLESQGFKDFGTNPLVTKPKQGFGWAPTISGYNPPIEQVLEDMMSAIGTDRAGEDETRRRSAGYYQSFRDNPSDIMGFANQFAGPITRQNPNAGDIYGVNLKTVMNRYAEELDKIMQERGESFPTRY